MTIIKRRTEDTLIKIGVICIYMLLSINLTYAQIKNITGIIIDEESREPLTGASVTVKGSRQGCISDLDGKFSLQPTLPGQQMLVISYIGYQTIEVPARHNMMEIRLRPNVNELDEVVVQVAYGTALKRSITGAVSVVDSKQIEMRPVSSVISVLNGAHRHTGLITQYFAHRYVRREWGKRFLHSYPVILRQLQSGGIHKGILAS